MLRGPPELRMISGNHFEGVLLDRRRPEKSPSGGVRDRGQLEAASWRPNLDQEIALWRSARPGAREIALWRSVRPGAAGGCGLEAHIRTEKSPSGGVRDRVQLEAAGWRPNLDRVPETSPSGGVRDREQLDAAGYTTAVCNRQCSIKHENADLG